MLMQVGRPVLVASRYLPPQPFHMCKMFLLEPENGFCRPSPWPPGLSHPTVSSSRWTVAIEKAGRHTAMYSAPPSAGVEYCTHSPP